MLNLLSRAVVALAAVQAASAACTNPSQRKAWTTLTDAEKLAYLDAEVCLMETPSKTGFAGSRTRWDELQAMHVAQVQVVHVVGAFLPWHRYFMKVHERLIREECNYRGVLPYWDQQADLAAAPLSASSIWDAKTGFGGPVSDSNDCVIDGPFVNITNNLRVDLSRGPEKCLTRKLSQTQFNLVSQAKVDLCFAAQTYDEFNTCIGGDVHVAGHYAAGGIMDDVSLSPADPLFFMHHTNLDRLWWKWQSEDLEARLTDISGANIAPIPFLAQAQPPSLPPLTAFFPYFGDNGGNVTTLNHNLWVGGTMPNVTIADVMDIRGETICAEYV